ncbi:hypothetical protein DLJ47_25965 [Micromonospora sp. S4605]|nr:hypothetical protein DLJ47_25965 [Micromonospora sp. S4605]
MEPQSRPTMPVGETVAGALAALAVGAYFATEPVRVAVYAGIEGLVSPGWTVAGLLAAPVLLLALVAPLLLTRVGGWWLAAAGLTALAVVDLVPALTGEPDQLPRSTAMVLVAVAGGGLAVGGTLLALAQLGRRSRQVVAVAFAAGVVLQPATPLADPGRSADTAVDLVAWVALLLVAGAALLTGGGAFTVPGPPVRRGVVPLAVAVAAAAAAVRWWLVERSSPRLPAERDVLAAPPPDRPYQIGLAVLAAMVLVGYAWYAWRATGARWVLAAYVLGPATLYGLGGVSDRASALLLPLVLAVVAVAVVVTRYADRALPWDAVALLLLGAAYALVAEVSFGREEASTAGHLLVLAFALAWAVAFLRAAGRPDPAPDPPAGLLTLGVAALLLGCQLLLPVLLGAGEAQPAVRTWGLPALAAGVALVVVLLFAVDLSTRDRRRTPPADPASVTADPASVTADPADPAPVTGDPAESAAGERATGPT